MLHLADDSLVDDFVLLVERPEHPQENRHVPILAQKHLGVAKLVGELLGQFLFRKHGLELAALDAEVRICATAPSTSYHFVPHHVSIFAVVGAGTEASLQESAAMPANGVLRGGDDFIKCLEPDFAKKRVFHQVPIPSVRQTGDLRPCGAGADVPLPLIPHRCCRPRKLSSAGGIWRRW